jgi:uncharacterized Zn-finger protein
MRNARQDAELYPERRACTCLPLARRYGAAPIRSGLFAMAVVGIPHFHNDPGVPAVHLGSREFMCIGATPPFDHPHVFLDMARTTRSSAPIARRSILHGIQHEPADLARAMRAGKFGKRVTGGERGAEVSDEVSPQRADAMR